MMGERKRYRESERGVTRKKEKERRYKGRGERERESEEVGKWRFNDL